MTEEEYNRKFAEATDRERGGWGLFWMLLLAPATLTLIIVTLGRLFFDIGTLEMLLGLLLLCSGAISAFLGDWLEERVSQGDFEVPIIKPILGFGIFLVNFYIIVGPGCSLLPH